MSQKTFELRTVELIYSNGAKGNELSWLLCKAIYPDNFHSFMLMNVIHGYIKIIGRKSKMKKDEQLAMVSQLISLCMLVALQ